MTSPIFKGRPRFSSRTQTPDSPDTALADGWHATLSDNDLARALVAVEGPFAVALPGPNGSMTLAVDRFAIHSLCYRIDGDRIAVAERADALAGPAAPLDPQAIYDYLYFHAIPSPRTAYKGVFRLPPGHYAVFANGHLRVAPYWVPTFDDAGHGESFDVLRDRFKALLRAGVATQLDGSKPACYLSGGTDSSTVAGMIREASGQRAASYSIGFDAAGYDEMAYARLAAQHFDTEHHEYYVTPDDLVRSIPEVAASYDQPFGNSSALPAYYCARMAREDGVSRILAGDGGDELFGGNTRYAKQRVFNWYAQVPAPLRGGLIEPLSSSVRGLPLLRKAWSYVEQARQPMPARMESYNLLLRLGVERVLSPAFRHQLDPALTLREQQAVWSAARTDSLLNRQLAFDWRYTLAECDLPKVCGTSRLAGLDVGFPMLDTGLVDFSTALPVAYKLRGLKLRWFFKEALRGFLPDAIITKKKQGFGLPFGVWALRHDGLRRLAQDALGTLAGRGIVEPAFLRELLDQRLAEHAGYYGEMVWILIMLEHWLRVHAPDYRVD